MNSCSPMQRRDCRRTRAVRPAEKVEHIFIERVKHYSDWPKVTDKLSLSTSSNQRRSTIRFVRYWSAMRRTPWQPLTWCSRNLRSVLS